MAKNLFRTRWVIAVATAVLAGLVAIALLGFSNSGISQADGSGFFLDLPANDGVVAVGRSGEYSVAVAYWADWLDTICVSVGSEAACIESAPEEGDVGEHLFPAEVNTLLTDREGILWLTLERWAWDNSSGTSEGSVEAYRWVSSTLELVYDEQGLTPAPVLNSSGQFRLTFDDSRNTCQTDVTGNRGEWVECKPTNHKYELKAVYDMAGGTYASVLQEGSESGDRDLVFWPWSDNTPAELGPYWTSTPIQIAGGLVYAREDQLYVRYERDIEAEGPQADVWDPDEALGLVFLNNEKIYWTTPSTWPGGAHFLLPPEGIVKLYGATMIWDSQTGEPLVCALYHDGTGVHGNCFSTEESPDAWFFVNWIQTGCTMGWEAGGTLMGTQPGELSFEISAWQNDREVVSNTVDLGWFEPLSKTLVTGDWDWPKGNPWGDYELQLEVFLTFTSTFGYTQTRQIGSASHTFGPCTQQIYLPLIMHGWPCSVEVGEHRGYWKSDGYYHHHFKLDSTCAFVGLQGPSQVQGPCSPSEEEGCPASSAIWDDRYWKNPTWVWFHLIPAGEYWADAVLKPFPDQSLPAEVEVVIFGGGDSYRDMIEKLRLSVIIPTKPPDVPPEPTPTPHAEP